MSENNTKIYLQLGANVGGDKFQEIIATLTEKSVVILVEPNKSLHPQLKQNYATLTNTHNIFFVDKAVVPFDKKHNKLYTYNDSGKSSFLKRRSHSCRNGEMAVDTITMSELINTFNVGELELLAIDTEGLDYEILNSLDITALNIKKIIFEQWPYSNDDENGEFCTGEEFLNNNLKPKFKDYIWEILNLDGNTNFMLTKTS